MRYAVYFTTEPDDPLTLAAQAWLGRDAFTGEAVDAPPPPGFTAQEHREVTADPRRYGFHATLVAPFRLRDGASSDDVANAADAFARGYPAFVMPSLSLKRIGGFFALVPDQHAEVAALASAAVDHFAHLRAPLTAAEIARRRPERLTGRQRAYLDQYGYPYVKDEFRFHMTLTGSLDDAAAARVEPGLRGHFSGFLNRPVDVSAIALFVEPAPGRDFVVQSVHRLAVRDLRKLA